MNNLKAVYLIGLLKMILGLIILFMSGTKDSNQYGAEPDCVAA